MEGRTLIAVVLMTLIWFYFFSPKQSPVQKNPTEVTNSMNPAPSATAIAKKASSTAVKKSGSQDLLSAKVFQLSNEDLEISVNGLGEIKDVRLLKYQTSLKDKSPVEMNFESLPFNSSKLSILGGQVEWSLIESSPQEIVWSAKGTTYSIIRRLFLPVKGYELKVSTEIENRSANLLKAQLSYKLSHPAVVHHQQPSVLKKLVSPQEEIHEAVVMQDGSVYRLNLAHDKASTVVKTAPISWTGFAQKYFFTGLIPQNFSIEEAKIESQLNYPNLETLKSFEKQIEPKEKGSFEYSLYLGPKDLSQLQAVGSDLTKVVRYLYDWVSPIARLLRKILIFFHAIIPNWGIAIILLTLLVKLLLLPLSIKAGISMRKLQRVQPKLKEIRERYKTDAQRQQAETLALWRQEKVNPFGGCLPIFIQFPVFFGLNGLFASSIEFRHAPFFGWIQDLSVHDPYFITPVLMTALMWLQQRITPVPPTTGETDVAKAQMAMLKWMPLIFGAFMLVLPAGLTVYYLVNAALSIVQQYYLNKHLNTKFPLPAQVAKRN